MINKQRYPSKSSLSRAIDTARGLIPADQIIRNVSLLDVFTGEFLLSDLVIDAGKIVAFGQGYSATKEVDGTGLYAVPGFIDAHVHIESSLMTPARFQEAVLPTGTTTVLWDPHEIANVKGKAGIEWALKASENLQLDVFLQVPSCVPSTSPQFELESPGAELYAADLRPFQAHPRVLGLAEMMNFPGLLNKDEDVLQKLQDFGAMKIDGHCPGLSGKDLNAYAVAGICSCHESTTAGEAKEKLSKGIHTLIREGSCAKDAHKLLPLLNAYTSSNIAFCSDDRNPLDIEESGHISCIVDMALRSGQAPEVVFRAASYGAAKIYGLDDRGALAPGYVADFNLVSPKSADWKEGFTLHSVYKSGDKVEAATLREIKAPKLGTGEKNLNLKRPTTKDFAIAAKGQMQKARVIGVIPEQILTHNETAEVQVKAGAINEDHARDLLKIAVLERHHNTGRIGVGLVRGFGIKQGAIATSINHDAHNIITVGSSDELIAKAVNKLIDIDGGIVVIHEDGRVEALALPIGGLMTDENPKAVAESLRKLKALTKAAGCVLDEPFLQLSFLALPVIPSLKITDRGLVNVDEFRKVSVIMEPE
ncbi:MAG: adenine deaminase [Proteobacteria bacterium]|nr:MAG: adenine deaminase [Pseudomonadota bacterium]